VPAEEPSLLVGEVERRREVVVIEQPVDVVVLVARFADDDVFRRHDEIKLEKTFEFFPFFQEPIL
jgi:hypothetical protein